MGYSVGISVDATGYRMVALDARHQTLKQLDRALSLSADPTTHLDDILEQISADLRGFLASDGLRDRRTLAIGIAPPGIVDTEKGIWLHGLQVSGITHVALGDTLETCSA
jgi:predicted NBD/HSP70 family sugar kinase